jgi:threonine/homoserine/homoserine lactone efflux protein
MFHTTLQTGAPGAPELLVLLLTVLIPLAVSVYVYRDAKRRGSRHALAWGLGSFFGSLVVWILYFVVRDEVGSR